MSYFLWAKFANGMKYHLLDPSEWGDMDCGQTGEWPLFVFRNVRHDEECRKCHRKFCGPSKKEPQP